MKKIISIFLLGLVSAVTVHADEFTILYAINAGDIVFDTIAISKTTVNSYNPFDGEGKYVGFLGADGYSFINFDKTNPATVRSGTIEVTGYNGDTSSNYYFLELANGESVVGYTDFVSYTDLQNLALLQF